MSRRRVTDRSSGEVWIQDDPDPARSGPPLAGPQPEVISLGPASQRGCDRYEVVVVGWRFELDVEDADLAELRARATSSVTGARADGPTEVRAIIPGRVVSLAVHVGATVEPGQRLLAVEAMKMENELRAPRAGLVERLAVAVGETVELGDVLVVLR
jgi:biotin carboxyl carrier protein